jgi:hypothetical protein
MLAFLFSSKRLVSKTTDRTLTRTQLRDLDKTPTRKDTHSNSLLSENAIGNFLPHSHSQIGSSDVEMDSEVQFRMIHRKMGKSF